MNDLYANYVHALQGLTAPTLFLDLKALNENINWAITQAGDKKIRLATKSIRCLEILKLIQKANPIFQGLMSYTLQEALWLRSQGLKDILIGYPTTDLAGLEELAKTPKEIVLMVDRIEHLDMLEKIAKKYSSLFEICLDIDLSLELPGLRFGVYRSNIYDEKSLSLFLSHLKKCSHLKLVGVMGYEAQIAGVIDKNSPLIKALKKISLPQLQKRREQLVKLINYEGHKIRMINGGGTGSLKHTIQESVVNEVTIGSAFYAPVLFDYYSDFQLSPALFFTSPIIRQPTKNIYTVLGGGYIASGATEKMKQPLPFLPEGLDLLKHEGGGEVQTPLRYSGKEKLKIGDLVIFRHAKAAEICERFNSIYILEENKIVNQFKTYRGEGKCFL